MALFWEDRWVHGNCISDLAPCLYQLVPSHTRQQQSVQEALTNRQWVHAIAGGLSQTAIEEYLELWTILEQINLIDQPDRLVWRWSPDGAYSTKSAHIMLKYNLARSISMVTGSCGRVGRRAESRSSFGWLCDAGTGRRIGELAIASRQETASISVIKPLKQSTTPSLHVRSLGNSGTSSYKCLASSSCKEPNPQSVGGAKYVSLLMAIIKRASTHYLRLFGVEGTECKVLPRQHCLLVFSAVLFQRRNNISLSQQISKH